MCSETLSARLWKLFFKPTATFLPQIISFANFLLIVSPFINTNHFGGFCYKINETGMMNVQLWSVHPEIAHIEPL